MGSVREYHEGKRIRLEGKRFVRPEDVETQVFDWGSIKWMCEPRVTKNQKFSAGVVIIEPGKGHRSHSHPNTEEMLYIISGVGDQLIEGATPKRQKVRAGDLVYVPPGVLHETINASWAPLVVLVVYSPPGPEVSLRKLPECKIIAPREIPKNI